jgi:hypothetical protein
MDGGSKELIMCLVLGLGWVGSNLMFWVGLNPSRVWLRGLGRTQFFCLVGRVEKDRMEGTFTPNY